MIVSRRRRVRFGLIDTHCHLTFPEFRDRVDDVVIEAARHAVTGLVTISTTVPDAEGACRIAARHERVWFSAGVHPLNSDRGPHDWAALARIARDPRCVAWGELGLDNHYDKPPRETQLPVLERHLACIEGSDRAGRVLPVVIHCREAYADLIPILRASGIAPERFVFHCFTGTPADMRMVLDFGAHVSFTGVVTYKNAPDVREAARMPPIDRVMVETDAPFISPEPVRSMRPCEPWMTSYTAVQLAALRGEHWDTFHKAINDNTKRFFGIPAK